MKTVHDNKIGTFILNIPAKSVSNSTLQNHPNPPLQTSY